MEELIFATLTKREEDDKEDLSYLFRDTSYYGTWKADDEDDGMVSRKKKKKSKSKQLNEEDIEMLCKYTSEEVGYYENN